MISLKRYMIVNKNILVKVKRVKMIEIFLGVLKPFIFDQTPILFKVSTVKET
jgi:hypothetical protein